MMTIWAFVVIVVMKRISDKCFFFQSSYQSKKSQNATKRHLFLLYQKLLRSMGDNAGNPHGPRQDGPPQIGGGPPNSYSPGCLLSGLHGGPPGGPPHAPIIFIPLGPVQRLLAEEFVST